MEFKSDEQFYRAIRNTNPNAWDSEANRPSSAAFKDSFGCSVDRRSSRQESEIIELMHNNLENDDAKIKAIVSVTKSICDEKEIVTKEDPIKDNSFHCLLIRNETKAELTPGQCKHLARNSVIVENNEIDFKSKSTV